MKQNSDVYLKERVNRFLKNRAFANRLPKAYWDNYYIDESKSVHFKSSFIGLSPIAKRYKLINAIPFLQTIVLAVLFFIALLLLTIFVI